MTVRSGDIAVSWLGYATARLAAADGPVAYTDPGRYGVLTGEWPPAHGRPSDRHPRGPPYEARDGDVVVVTHDHHYDADGVQRVAADDATLVVYEAVSAERIRATGREVEPPEDLPYDVVRVGYGDAVEAGGVRVEATPAYNRPDGPWGDVRDGEPLHPAGFGCGFVLTLDGHRCWWPGDTDVLDAHRELDVSTFLPPIGAYTMDRQDAAALAGDLDPELVVPIHYNTFEALSADSVAFTADVARRGVPVALDEGGPAE